MSFESSGDLPLLPPESIFQQVMEAVPERCQDCGVQCQLAAQLAHSLLMKHLLTHVAEDLVGQSGEEFNAMIDTYAPAEIAASLKQITRETTATNLDEIDTAIDATKQEMLDNSKACVAPLKMRASKGEATYTVTVCTSAEQYSAKGHGHLPTHIQTQPRNQ